MGFQRAAQPLEATTIPLPGNRKRDFFCSIQWEASPPEGEGVSLRMPETNQKTTDLTKKHSDCLAVRHIMLKFVHTQASNYA